ncbi:MAG: D-alanyl-D-alanine carboxypeptidase, partial [Clostridia bacterium]|nr:D-alanyl-D-alanine carboxypeptidase [Clostridia bacterium]
MSKRILSLIAALCLFLSVGSVAASAEDAAPQSAVSHRYDPALQAEAADAPAIGSRVAYVADPATGKVLYEKNAHEAVYPASTTKLLTALLVVENCDLSEMATVSREALRRVPSDYVDADLEVGERLSVLDLLKALLIPSANDVAFVLAEHVSGTTEAFVARMNERAAELGCESVHFVNPNGIHNAEHVCSAYDLFLIARECRKHEVLREIVQTKSFTLPATEQHPEEDRTFLNSNEMLLLGPYYYSYCTGMKTGRTDAAGECLVASSERDGMELISVVLGGRIVDGVTERFIDTRSLLDFAYENYAFQTVASLGDTA